MPATPAYALPYPDPNEPDDVPADLHELALAVEAALASVGIGSGALDDVPVWNGTKWAPRKLVDAQIAGPISKGKLGPLAIVDADVVGPIGKGKLAPLHIVDADVDSISAAKITGLPSPTTGSFRGCLLRQSAPQHLPAQAVTVLTWDLEPGDLLGWHAAGGSRITVDATGLYLVSGWVAVSGGGMEQRLLRNGAVVAQQGTPAQRTWTGVFPATAGDYFELGVFNSASSTDYDTVLSGETPSFAVAQVG